MGVVDLPSRRQQPSGLARVAVECSRLIEAVSEVTEDQLSDPLAGIVVEALGGLTWDFQELVDAREVVAHPKDHDDLTRARARLVLDCHWQLVDRRLEAVA